LIVADLSPSSLKARLENEGLRLRTGPIVTKVRSSLASIANGIALHYCAHSIEAVSGFADFQVSIERPRSLRRWMQPQAVFRFDDNIPFAPLPGNQAFPMFEWGLNWCVSHHCNQFLTLHAAVVERHAAALVLPAPAGSGKSTLCAGLVFNGWRLLSDELTIIDPGSNSIVPLPRPVSLKNASIEVIRGFAPSAIIGPVVEETAKGQVAHVRPPADAVARAEERATARWIIFPRYAAESEARLEPLGKAAALMRLVESSFNYNVHGRSGFEMLCEMVGASDCYEFGYARLPEAVAMLDRLTNAPHGPA
jgi:HprK-related kinase A